MARPPAAEALLSPELIIATALRLIDSDGLEALSMRKLATELAVTPRSLYHYVPTKDALLREIYLHVLNKLELPERNGQDWREVLRGLAREFRRLCHQHHSVMPYFLAGHEPAPRDTAILELMFELLHAAGLPRERLIPVSQNVITFLAGYILEELNGIFRPQYHEMRLAIAREHPEQFPWLLQLPPPPALEEENFIIALDLLIAAIEGQLV